MSASSRRRFAVTSSAISSSLSSGRSAPDGSGGWAKFLNEHHRGSLVMILTRRSRASSASCSWMWSLSPSSAGNSASRRCRSARCQAYHPKSGGTRAPAYASTRTSLRSAHFLFMFAAILINETIHTSIGTAPPSNVLTSPSTYTI
jgi:hypothetical protein